VIDLSRASQSDAMLVPIGRAGDATRVTAIIDAATLSGPGRQLAAVATALGDLGTHVHVLTFRRVGRGVSPLVDHLRGTNVPVTIIDDGGPLDLTLVRRLSTALAHTQPDVIQTHGYRPTALVYLLRRMGMRYPWVAFYHGSTRENRKVRFYHWLDQRLMPSADRIVVMSRKHAEAFASPGSSHVRVLHNAVIPVHDDRTAVQRVEDMLSDLRLDPPVIGVIGRLSREKGVDVFIDAARRLAERSVPFSAVIAGDGPERSALEALVRAAGLGDRIRFLGELPTAAPLYPRLDLLVIPSRSEGLPNVLLEALRADRPVVATAVGAVPEVITDAQIGAVVPIESPEALADAIVTALPLLHSAEAAAARRDAADRFSLDRRARGLQELYDELLLPPVAAPARGPRRGVR
jgi:glycosyltransferase involved in cell wall biosynthesis